MSRNINIIIIKLFFDSRSIKLYEMSIKILVKR